MVYCDVKFGNVFFDYGLERVMLIDFGFVCVVDDVSLICMGVIVGMLYYMFFE